MVFIVDDSEETECLEIFATVYIWTLLENLIEQSEWL